MIAQMRDRIDRAGAFIRTPAPAVIAPFRAGRPPFEHAVRYYGFLTLCVALGIFYGFFYTVLPPAFLVIMMLPIAILILFVIWALPDRRTAPTRALVWLFFAFYVITIMWPTYLAIALPGLPWISLRRLVGAPLAVLLLVCVSTSPDFRRETADALRSTPGLLKMLVGFTLIQALTVFLADRPIAALYLFINDLIVWTSIAFISVYAFLKPGRITNWFVLSVTMALVLCAVGLVEWRHQGVLWANHIPPFLQIGDESVARMLESNFRDGRYRVTTTFSIALAFAEYLALTVPFVIHKMVTTDGIFRRTAWFAADIVLLIIIYLTTARLGLVGWIAAHAFYGMLWSVRRWRTLKSDLLGPALTLAYPALLAVLLLAITTVDALKYRVLSGGSTGFSDDAREVQFQMAQPVILKNPFGYGPGQGGEALGFTSPGGQLTIDSYLLSVALDYGVIGFLLFYGMIAYGIYRMALLSSVRRDDELDLALPLSVALAVFLIIKTVLSQEDNHSVLFMLLGMTAAIQYRANQFDKQRPPEPSRRN